MATLKQVPEFFGYSNLAQFRQHWAELDAESKDQLRAGIGDGSLTY